MFGSLLSLAQVEQFCPLMYQYTAADADAVGSFLAYGRLTGVPEEPSGVNVALRMALPGLVEMGRQLID